MSKSDTPETDNLVFRLHEGEEARNLLEEAALFESQRDEARRQLSEAQTLIQRNPIPSGNAYDMLDALDAAGMGKAGSDFGNTLTGMVFECIHQLTESQAREVALREALETFMAWGQAGWNHKDFWADLKDARRRASSALTQPAPPVVPLASLQDSSFVHLNILHGKIVLTREHMLHLLGDKAQEAVAKYDDLWQHAERLAEALRVADDDGDYSDHSPDHCIPKALSAHEARKEKA